MWLAKRLRTLRSRGCERPGVVNGTMDDMLRTSHSSVWELTASSGTESSPHDAAHFAGEAIPAALAKEASGIQRIRAISKSFEKLINRHASMSNGFCQSYPLLTCHAFVTRD